MIINFFGNLFFSNCQSWQRRRETKRLVLAVLTGLVFASLIGLIIFLKIPRTDDFQTDGSIIFFRRHLKCPSLPNREILE